MISVIIPVFNEARVGEAIASVQEQVTDHEVEIIVVDDGSTDGCADGLVDGPGLRILRRENGGPSRARNLGIAEARGELISFLDADDLWPPGRLARLETALATRPDLRFVLGRIQYKAVDGGVLPDVQWEDPEAKTMSHVHLGSGLYRRAVFDEVGTLVDEMFHAEDMDWFLRVREGAVPYGILPSVTLTYRLHTTNMTQDHQAVLRGAHESLRRSIRRRREQGLGAPQDLPSWRSHDLPCADVTVVIPAYNRAHLVAETIRSVHAQTVLPRKVIVVDDGSTDDTAAVAESLGATVLRRPNGGLGAAHNTGFRAADTEWIASLDSDDLWEPDFLEQQMKAADRTGADVLLTGATEFAGDPNDPGAVSTPRPGACSSSLVFKRATYEAVGPFQEDLTTDWADWVDRARNEGHRDHVDPARRVLRRLHADNMSRQPVNRSNLTRVAKAALDRRRATS